MPHRQHDRHPHRNSNSDLKSVGQKHDRIVVVLIERAVDEIPRELNDIYCEFVEDDQ